MDRNACFETVVDGGHEVTHMRSKFSSDERSCQNYEIDLSSIPYLLVTKSFFSCRFIM